MTRAFLRAGPAHGTEMEFDFLPDRIYVPVHGEDERPGHWRWIGEFADIKTTMPQALVAVYLSWNDGSGKYSYNHVERW